MVGSHVKDHKFDKMVPHYDSNNWYLAIIIILIIIIDMVVVSHWLFVWSLYWGFVIYLIKFACKIYRKSDQSELNSFLSQWILPCEQQWGKRLCCGTHKPYRKSISRNGNVLCHILFFFCSVVLWLNEGVEWRRWILVWFISLWFPFFFVF